MLLFYLRGLNLFISVFHPVAPLQELHSDVNDIVEDILKMHDTTKVTDICVIGFKKYASNFCPFRSVFFFFFFSLDANLAVSPTTQEGHLTLEDYQIWSVRSALANEFLNLLFQVVLMFMHFFCPFSMFLVLFFLLLSSLLSL